MVDLRDDLILARNMRQRAYSPYSNYTVGAVLKTKNGKKYTGCNVENSGIQSICAERVAFCKAIGEGEREFESILVLGGKKGESPEKYLPCGYCRQFMREFVDDDFKIYTVYDNKIEEYTFNELLPNSFKI